MHGLIKQPNRSNM